NVVVEWKSGTLAYALTLQNPFDQYGNLLMTVMSTMLNNHDDSGRLLETAAKTLATHNATSPTGLAEKNRDRNDHRNQPRRHHRNGRRGDQDDHHGNRHHDSDDDDPHDDDPHDDDPHDDDPHDDDPHDNDPHDNDPHDDDPHDDDPHDDDPVQEAESWQQDDSWLGEAKVHDSEGSQLDLLQSIRIQALLPGECLGSGTPLGTTWAVTYMRLNYTADKDCRALTSCTDCLNSGCDWCSWPASEEALPNWVPDYEWTQEAFRIGDGRCGIHPRICRKTFGTINTCQTTQAEPLQLVWPIISVMVPFMVLWLLHCKR
ncbi:putative transmembrane protein, partial [Gregarina niphandrodes]